MMKSPRAVELSHIARCLYRMVDSWRRAENLWGKAAGDYAGLPTPDMVLKRVHWLAELTLTTDGGMLSVCDRQGRVVASAEDAAGLQEKLQYRVSTLCYVREDPLRLEFEWNSALK